MTLSTNQSRVGIERLLFAGNPEAMHYLEKYRSATPGRFALIKASGECMEDNISDLVQDLSSLSRLGLIPNVIYGWGKAVNKKLESMGYADSEFIEGKRVTGDHEVIAIESVINDFMEAFDLYAEAVDLKYQVFSAGEIFTDVEPDEAKFGYVAKINGVNTAPLIAACEEGKVPLIAPVCYIDGQMYNINADDAAQAIGAALDPMKSIFLTGVGGIYDSPDIETATLLKKIGMRGDYEKLVAEGTFDGGMLKKVEAIKAYLEVVSKGAAVQVASPETLLTEMFTYHGAGTKVVMGYHFNKYPDAKSDVDQDVLIDLISGSIGKTLVDGYFEKNGFSGVIVEEDYGGCAIMQPYNGWHYLDKFAVDPELWSTGIGSEMMDTVIEHALADTSKKGVFWRSDRSNERANRLYANKILEMGGGFQTVGKWGIYWIGDASQDVVSLTEYASNKPEDFLPLVPVSTE